MLKLTKDHRGFFILSKINNAGQRPIRVIFPPHAERLATQAFDRTTLFLAEVNKDPTHPQLAKVMIGLQVTAHRTSPARGPKRRNVPPKNK
jgi:hypothetical protein